MIRKAEPNPYLQIKNPAMVFTVNSNKKNRPAPKNRPVNKMFSALIFSFALKNTPKMADKGENRLFQRVL